LAEAIMPLFDVV